MSKNYINDTLKNRVPNTINQVIKDNKGSRSDQLQFKGYFQLVTGTADPTGAPNGSVYYNTSTNKLRLKKNTGWVDVI